MCFYPTYKAGVVLQRLTQGRFSPPTCGRKQSGSCAPPVTPHCSQAEGVAHSRGQVGQDTGRRCGWEVHLLDLAIPGDVHHLVARDLGARFLPPQGDGRLCGLSLLQISRRVEI